VSAGKNRQLSCWRFFYARAIPRRAGVRAARFDEIDKNLLISWTSARS